MNAGRWSIVAVVFLAVGAASLAAWYRWHETQNVLRYFGGENANLIRSGAESIEALRIMPVDRDVPSEDDLWLGGTAWQIVDRRDVTEAPGFTNARAALTIDRNFDWRDRASATATPWQYALRFRRADQSTTLAFAFDPGRVGIEGAEQSVGLDGQVASVLKLLMDAHFNRRPPETTADQYPL